MVPFLPLNSVGKAFILVLKVGKFNSLNFEDMNTMNAVLPSDVQEGFK